VGIGTNLQAVAQQFTQGSITTTDNPMDLAINGAGFFQVNDGKSPTTYTRNGQFKVDRDGYIVNNTKQQLMGYAANSQGVIQAGQAVALQLPTAGVAPKTTGTSLIELNLNASDPVKTAASGSIDFADAKTFNFPTSQTVYDAQGQSVEMTYYFQKTSADNWNVYATANGSPILDSGGAVATLTTLTFAADGSAPTSPTAPVSFDVQATALKSGGNSLPITGVLLDLTKATQFAGQSAVTNITQNGYAAGQLTGISVEGNGVVTANYSDGQTRPAGQIEVANFRNPQGLQPIGDNAWARTFASGDPVTGVPGDGNLGSLQSGALEESNVDLTGELVNMITAQRIYQANAQTIKTQDQVLQTLVNLR